MPFKRNRSRQKDQLTGDCWHRCPPGLDNTAHSLLERTLDDPANRRAAAGSCLIVDELLITADRLVTAYR
jgi:hypothetical protein